MSRHVVSIATFGCNYIEKSEGLATGTNRIWIQHVQIDSTIILKTSKILLFSPE